MTRLGDFSPLCRAAPTTLARGAPAAPLSNLLDSPSLAGTSKMSKICGKVSVSSFSVGTLVDDSVDACRNGARLNGLCKDTSRSGLKIERRIVWYAEADHWKSNNSLVGTSFIQAISNVYVSKNQDLIQKNCSTKSHVLHVP